jgi:hypothetical protein
MNSLNEMFRTIASERVIEPFGPPLDLSTTNHISVIGRRAGSLRSGERLFALSQSVSPEMVYILTRTEMEGLLTPEDIEAIENA